MDIFFDRRVGCALPEKSFVDLILCQFACRESLVTYCRRKKGSQSLDQAANDPTAFLVSV